MSALAQPNLRPSSTELPRLLRGIDSNGDPVGVHEHLSLWGPLPSSPSRAGLIGELEESGLVGHGGAWFPVAAKWRSVRGGVLSRPVVVINGAEGEPASSKDALLLARAPHLVLDGASLAASELGASRVVAYVPAALAGVLESAIADRRPLALDPVGIEVVVAPDRFIAGQESAVVNVLNRRAPVPTFVGIRPVRQNGVNGQPTLVQNVETLANVALIARFGSTWFRALGAATSPGTMLLTVTGRWSTPQIVESALGLPLRDVLRLSDDQARHYWGVLLGGYGGGWVSMETALALPLTELAARQKGASLGAGVVVLVPRSACPLAVLARVVRYLERQKANQCGPCVNGLTELDELCTSLAVLPSAMGGHIQPIIELCELVEGRGACRHPDGAARFIRSALNVFAEDVSSHLRAGPCRQSADHVALPGLDPIARVSRRRVPA